METKDIEKSGSHPASTIGLCLSLAGLILPLGLLFGLAGIILGIVGGSLSPRAWVASFFAILIGMVDVLLPLVFMNF